MKSYIGIGKGKVELAVDEAVRGIGSPVTIIFLSSYAQIKDVSKILHEKFPKTQIIGTLGTKLANGTYGDDNLVVLGLYEDAKTECGIIRDISLCPVASVGKINEMIRKVSPGRDNTVCIEFCTNDEEKLVTTFNSCLAPKGIKLAGGTVKFMRMRVFLQLSKIRPEKLMYLRKTYMKKGRTNITLQTGLTQQKRQ